MITSQRTSFSVCYGFHTLQVMANRASRVKVACKARNQHRKCTHRSASRLNKFASEKQSRSANHKSRVDRSTSGQNIQHKSDSTTFVGSPWRCECSETEKNPQGRVFYPLETGLQLAEDCVGEGFPEDVVPVRDSAGRSERH